METKPRKKITVGEPRRLTIGIPFDIWLKLRDLQNQGKIRSIQEAVVVSLREFCEEKDKI